MHATTSDWRGLRGSACMANAPSSSGHLCKPSRPSHPRVAPPRAPGRTSENAVAGACTGTCTGACTDADAGSDTVAIARAEVHVRRGAAERDVGAQRRRECAIGMRATTADWRERRGEACLASGSKPNRPALQAEPFVEPPHRVPPRPGQPLQAEPSVTSPRCAAPRPGTHFQAHCCWYVLSLAMLASVQ